MMDDEQINQAYAQMMLQKRSRVEYSDDDIDRLYAEKMVGEQSAGPQDRPVEAFTQGFGNAATFGYLPQIQAATEPAIQKVMDYFGGDNTDEKLKEQGFSIEQAPEESYVERRDRFIRRGQKLAEENPGATIAGGVSGSLASGIVTGGGLGKLLGTAGKAASMGKRFGDAAKTGATIGALRNPGDTEGEVSPLQLKERTENAVKDAATGAVIQGGLDGAKAVGTGIKNAGKNIKYWSQNKAFKAAGAEKPAFKKAILNKKNTELGQTVIDEDLIGGGSDVQDIAKNAEARLADAGNKLGAIYKKADSTTTLSTKEIRDEFFAESAERLSGTAQGDKTAQKLNDLVETMPSGKDVTFESMKKWRSSIDDEINYAKANEDLPKYQAELLKLRSKVQEKIADQIGKVNPQLKREFLKENKRFSNLTEITNLAKAKAGSVEGNASYGMREGQGSIVGSVIGSAIGGPLGAATGAAVGAITTNIARRYATPFVAMTANKVARALEKRQDAIGKFSKPLIEAANNPEKFVATINGMMKDPEFKRQVQRLDQPMQIYRGPAKGERK